MPAGVCWALVAAQDDPAALFPQEATAIACARAPRRAEFIGGRIAARAALAQLGLPETPLPVGADRLPQWPEGVLGSISHAGGLCLAAVIPKAQALALGIDLEVAPPLEPALIPVIARPEELEATPPAQWPDLALRLFSAKEAAYKAQFPATRHVFGFHGMQVTWTDPAQGTARLTDHPETAPITGPWRSRALPLWQAQGAGWVASVCLVPKDRAPR